MSDLTNKASYLKGLADGMKLDTEKFYCNVDHIGNTSGASIFICLAEMEEKSLLKSGQRLLMTGFGSGLTWGSVIAEYRSRQ